LLAGHGIGALAPGRQSEPEVELQGTGWDEPQKKPAGQMVTSAPTQNWPAGQVTGADEPAMHIWPSGQAVGAVTPGAQVARGGQRSWTEALGQ
jgi:hypothetical protein